MKFRNCLILTKKKKILLSLILIVLAILSLFACSGVSYAEDVSSKEISTEISLNIENILQDIDFSGLQDVVSDINSFDFFNNGVKDRVQQILNGNYFTNYSSLFSAIISLLIVDVKNCFPFMLTLIAIGILANLLSEFKSSNESTSDIVHFACFGIMIIIVLYTFKDVLTLTSSTLSLILRQMQLVFPILIAMLASIGSFSTISIYNPLVAVLTTIVSVVFEKFLYPLFIAMFLFTILGSITSTIKLDKIQSFISSSFKWIVGIVFTLFTAFLSLQGISAGKFDGVSIKATKFAVKSYIPIIGSYLSEGMDFLVLSSVLVKNTIGLVGVFILFLSVLSPIISIVILKLCLQLSSAILELSGSNRTSNFLNGCSRILVYPIVLILGVAFMYVITIALIMCTANIF